MQVKNTIENKSRPWTNSFRPRVNETVFIGSDYYTNITGINSDPRLNLGDWVFVGNFSKYSKLKIATKGEGNSSANIEIGDIVYGLLDDGITFIPFGKYLGGNLQVVESYLTNPIEFS